MKNLHKNLFTALVVAALVGGSLDVMAQYPAASALLVNDVTKYTVNSTEDYIRIEGQITALGESIRDAYKVHPNLSYMPVYNGDQIVAFMINGVKDSEDADQISHNLMQLEILADAVKSMDESYLPAIKDTKLSRVSRKVASK